MLNDLLAPFAQSIQNVQLVILAVNVILHLLFSAGIAKDVGFFNSRGIQTRFVSGMTWVLATLLGGVMVVVIYWFIHHSGLAKTASHLKEKS